MELLSGQGEGERRGSGCQRTRVVMEKGEEVCSVKGGGARVLSEYVQINQNSLIYTSLFKYSTVGNIHTKQGVNRE